MTATAMVGVGGVEDGWRDADEKGKGRQPFERLPSAQSQPDTTVFLPAQQPNRPPSVPAPAPECRGGGIAARAVLAAPFSPHPGTVHQAGRRRRRMRGDHRQAAGSLQQAGWVGKHLQRDGGALALAVSPASRPLSLRRQRGMGCTGKMAAPQRPAALAQARQGWHGSQAPGGADGMGVRRPRQDQSSPPIPSEGAGGRPQPSAAAAGTALSRKPPPWMGSPTPAYGDRPVPQRCPATVSPAASGPEPQAG